MLVQTVSPRIVMHASESCPAAGNPVSFWIQLSLPWHDATAWAEAAMQPHTSYVTYICQSKPGVLMHTQAPSGGSTALSCPLSLKLAMCDMQPSITSVLSALPLLHG